MNKSCNAVKIIAIGAGLACVVLSLSLPVFAQKHTKSKSAKSEPIIRGLEKRKAIFWDICAAQDKAGIEAKHRYPLTDSRGQVSDSEVSKRLSKRIDLKDSLRLKYESTVRKKYHLSTKEAKAIAVEGAIKNWPTPPLKEAY